MRTIVPALCSQANHLALILLFVFIGAVPQMVSSPPAYAQATVSPGDVELSARLQQQSPELRPPQLSIELAPGETARERKTALLPGPPPEVDVLFMFDLTGSMGQELESLKLNAVEVLEGLSELAPSVRFGLSSFQDYDGKFQTSTEEGHPCDYPSPTAVGARGYGGSFLPNVPRPFVYHLDKELTGEVDAVVYAIGAVDVTGAGGDVPEAYARALYEGVAELVGDIDPDVGRVGWRQGARKLIVMYGDAVPHDCDLWGSAGISPYPNRPDYRPKADFGLDPGRDSEIGTEDDLRILEVLEQVSKANVTLISIYSGSKRRNRLWKHYARLTGGTSYAINSDGTFPSGTSVVEGITELIGAAVSHVNELRLQACVTPEDYGDWITSVSPTVHSDVDLPAERSFSLELGPPRGTDPGIYTFDICAIGDGAEFARQKVTVTVAEGSDEEELEPGTLTVTIEKGSQAPASNVILVFDASRSMWGRVEELPKIAIAKKVVGQVIDSLPEGRRVGLRVYGHRTRPGRPGACEDTELLVPLAPLDRLRLREAVADVVPRGTTPIAGTLRKVAGDFASGGEGERLVVLVTDGKEECGGDPSASVEELQEAGIDPRIEVVGFALADEATKREMEEIAQLTGGRFHDARNPDDLQQSLTAALGVPVEVLDAGGNVAARGSTGSPLSLPAGVYRVIVAIPGEPVEVSEVRISPGETTNVELQGSNGSANGTDP